MEVFIPITFFVCVAAVLILRPMTKRIGILLEAMAQQKTGVVAPSETPDARIVALLEHVSRRLDQIEERVDFTERLVSTRSADDAPRRPLSRAGH